MPRYPYECPKCEARCDVFKPMAECRTPEKCDVCGAPMVRVFNRAPSTPDQAYHKSIEMFSVAPTGADEYNDLRRKLPDTEFTPQLVPIARSPAEHRRILEATGFENRSGRGG